MFGRFLGLTFLLVLLTGCSEPPYTNLNNEEFAAMLRQGVPVFDVRRPEEWRQTGVVENSRLLTFVDAGGRVKPGFFERFTSQVGKHDPVILICRTGNRTATLARYLVEEMGYTQVYNVRHGITSWIRNKYPVSRP